MKKLLIALMCSTTMLSAYEGLTRYDLRQESRKQLVDNPKFADGTADTSRQRWTDAELNRRIEIAQADITRKTACLLGTTYYTTYTSTPVYQLPGDLAEVYRVAVFEGLVNSATYYRKIEHYTFAGMDAFNTGWQGFANSRPEKYIVWGDKLWINPPASEQYAMPNGMMVQYIVNPSSFTSDASKPFNDQVQLYPYHELIIYKVCEMCKMDERLANEATYFLGKYNAGITLMDKEVSSLLNFDPSFHGR